MSDVPQRNLAVYRLLPSLSDYETAAGEGLDVDARLAGQRLDVDGEPDRGEGELPMLGEMVADDREAGGVRGVDVGDAAGIQRLGARGRARVLGTHREARFFLGGQALALGLQSRRGPSHVCGCGRSGRAYASEPGRNPAELGITTLPGDQGCCGGSVGRGGFGGVLAPGLRKSFDHASGRVVGYRDVTRRDPVGRTSTSAQTALRGAGPWATPQRSASALVEESLR